MNGPAMVNTFKEIAQKQDVALRRKAEKLCNGLIRGYTATIPLQKEFLLIQQNGLFRGNYSVLVYQ